MRYEELSVGMSHTERFIITCDMIETFAWQISDDCNPIHLDETYAAKTRFGGRIAHGLIAGSKVSGLLGMQLPGEGTLWLEQNFKFVDVVRPDDEIEVTVTVSELLPKGRVKLTNLIQVVDGPSLADGREPFTVITGESLVLILRQKVAA